MRDSLQPISVASGPTAYRDATTTEGCCTDAEPHLIARRRPTTMAARTTTRVATTTEGARRGRSSRRMKTDEVIIGLLPRRVIEQARDIARGSFPAEGSPHRDVAALRAVIDRFDSEERCRSYLERLRWPNGVR